jgi:hypothetical protein
MYPSEEKELEQVMRELLTSEEQMEQTSPLQPVETAKSNAVDKPGTSALKYPPSKEESNEPDDIADSDDSAFETLHTSPSRIAQRRATVTNTTTTTTPDPRQQLQTAIIQQNQHHQPQPQRPAPVPRPRPWQPTNPFEPLKLTPLSAIPHLPYRQNWMVNVLAVVASLAPVEPSHIGPSYQQRAARLADASTHKRVHLSVYLDPEGFTPRVGGVVLLLGVKNHLFEGGSLRKYVSDRPKGGGSWWVERPERLGWCEGEVERLKGWWEEEGRGGLSESADCVQ